MKKYLRIFPVVFYQGLAAVVSGVFLFASFPPLEWAAAAWIALVPLLVICVYSPPGWSFRFGLLCGVIFWLLSVSWVIHVSYLGWVCLGVYCALFIACFSMTVSWWIRRRGIHGRIGNPLLMLTIPAMWVGFEFLRSTLISGFPWNPLGVSQFNNLVLIQCAQWGGVYLVSYIIAMVNTALALTIVQYLRMQGSKRYRAHPELMISIAVLALSFVYGNKAMRQFNSTSGTLTIAAIQPNIIQVEKWSEEYIDEIYARLKNTTESVIKRFAPDLVVWPETAVPDFVRYSSPSQKVISDLLVYGVPILVGSMDAKESATGTNYYNSSLLFTQDHNRLQSYDKQHLVIFGEYIPMEHIFPFLKTLSPIEGSFTSGKVSTIFRLDRLKAPFAVLICFEDTVPSLARKAVWKGARLLINQTNDAWFDPSCASRQQMTHCVFRCVENRVAAVRATNTGITCFINQNGVVYGMLKPARGHLPEPEFSIKSVFVPGADMPMTFYTKYGDIFAIMCLAVTLPLFVATVLMSRRKVR